MSVILRRIGAASLAGLLATSVGALAQPSGKPKPAPAKPAAPAPAQPAPAQSSPAQPQAGAQQPPAPTRVELQASQSDWTKVCGADPASNKEICYTTRDFGQGPDQPPVLALAVYDVKGDDTKIVRLLMPPALLLRPGFRFSIDKGAAMEGAFEICFPNGCFAEAKVRAATVDTIKTGTVMNVAVKNQFNTEVTFGLPLAGFGKAYDGAPIDPKVLEEQQKQLREEMAKRAEQERSKLETAAPAAAAPAPSAPAR